MTPSDRNRNAGRPQINIGRRFLLGLGIGAATLLGPVRAFAAAIGNPGNVPYPMTALAPYLDTLIPRTDTGSATEFGIDEYLRHRTRLNIRYMHLIRTGCQWLDDQARHAGAPDFATLDEPQRELIVERAASAPNGTPQRIFFDATRDDAMKGYYSDPRSWAAVGFKGPPQPEGYRDHAGPPS